MELDAGEKKLQLLEELRGQIQEMSDRDQAWIDYQSIYMDKDVALIEQYNAFFKARVAFSDLAKIL